MKPDPEVMGRFLNHLFGNELRGLVELAWRDPQDGKLRHAQLYHLDKLDALVAKALEVNSHEGANAYIGAAIRHPDTPPFARANDDDFLCAPAYWADLDDAAAVKTAKQKCGRAPANLGVITGRTPHPRAQLYWRCEEAITDPRELRETNATIARALGGDPAVINPGRIMRLPGSIAWPVKSGRVAELVELQTWIDRPPAYVEGEVAAAFPLDASALNTATVEDVFGKSSPPDRWVETLRDGAGEGERNTTAAALAGYLFRCGVGPDETLGILRCVNDSRFKPPLGERELRGVLESICKAELRRRGAK